MDLNEKLGGNKVSFSSLEQRRREEWCFMEIKLFTYLWIKSGYTVES